MTSARDRPLKPMRERARWEAVLAACPAHVQWADAEPLTDVLPMGGVVDRYRRLVVDGAPVITGVALLGDAWACTNPSAGRGMTLGILHARHLRDLARESIDDPLRFALAWDEVTESHLTPWYRDTGLFRAFVETRACLATVSEIVARPARPSGSSRSPVSTSRCCRRGPTTGSCRRC